MSDATVRAAQHAAASVDFVERKFGFRLPYTPESLILIDRLIDKIRETGAREDQVAGVLAGLGCYAGEVFVRHARASWRAAAEIGVSAPSHSLPLLVLPGLVPCDPIGRVYERFGDPRASVAALYEALVASHR